MSDVTTTVTDGVKTTGLSADDIKALRQADTICFDQLKDQVGQIRAIKRGRRGDRDLFRTQDAERVIPCKSRVWASLREGVTQNDLTAFEYCGSAKYDSAIQTILGLLKPGDEVELEWRTGGNGYLERSRVTEKEPGAEYSPGMGERLYHDRLTLSVRRRGERKYTFNVADSVCPNNTARMIRGL
jgi:hypothetical protein